MRMFDARPRVETAQDGFQLAQLIGADKVGFVEHQHIAKFHLIDQQIDHRAVIFLTQRFTAHLQAVARTVVTQKVQSIDHRHHGVQPRHIGQAAAFLVGKRKGFGHWQRFGDASGFDHQLVEMSFARQLRHFHQQVFAQRAADAAVAHLDQLFIST